MTVCAQQQDVPLLEPLLFALDQGWHIAEPVYRERPMGRQPSLSIYRFVLLRFVPKKQLMVDLLQLPDSEALQQFIQSHGLTVLDGLQTQWVNEA